jgi:asparagine synthase (glutamine-hydrolysing)
MCGIFGFVVLEGAPPDLQLLESMGNSIVHRGPDDAGYFISGGVGLGIRRLSIIDLSSGHQPIFNEDRTKVIVFNGEVYNFRELRRCLEEKGHAFSTSTDTEVILHLYEEKGDSCVEDLVGMFAFAIWDERKRRLFIARDRFGEKPLHYFWDGRRLVFGSEIKSLLCDLSIGRELDWEAVGDYFTFMNTIAPRTIFRGIKKLPPGHRMILEGGRLATNRYWEYNLTSEQDKGEVFYRETVLERFKEAVKAQLVSDVPLGAFLSGGIDSSAIVALMSQVSGPVKTFSIGFMEDSYDELEYAREIARIFGTEHSEYVLKPDAVDSVQEIIWHLDEPFADPSAIPTYFVSKIAREQVTVALSGDGGDELFAGYPGYRAEQMLNRAAAFPRWIRRGFTERILKNLPSLPWASANYKIERLKRIMARVEMLPAERFFSRHTLFTEEEKRVLLCAEAVDGGAVKDTHEYLAGVDVPPGDDPINVMLALDANIYLPNDMLVKVDRMSMAHSLEVRAPFLDYRLAETVASLPSKYKVSGSTTKYIFRKAMEGILPESVLKRGKKGFSVPLEVWFRGDLAGFASEVLLDERTGRRGYLNLPEVDGVLKSHANRKADRSGQIWALVVFEMWCRLFLDRNGTT